jgi:hypothetical protein
MLRVAFLIYLFRKNSLYKRNGKNNRKATFFDVCTVNRNGDASFPFMNAKHPFKEDKNNLVAKCQLQYLSWRSVYFWRSMSNYPMPCLNDRKGKDRFRFGRFVFRPGRAKA